MLKMWEAGLSPDVLSARNALLGGASRLEYFIDFFALFSSLFLKFLAEVDSGTVSFLPYS